MIKNEEINNYAEENLDVVFYITNAEQIENETNNDKSEENDTIADRIINWLGETNSEIETIVDNLNESNYHDDAT